MQDSAGTRVNIIILRRRTFTLVVIYPRARAHGSHVSGLLVLHVGLLRVLGCELCLERNQICPDVLSNHNNAVMTQVVLRVQEPQRANFSQISRAFCGGLLLLLLH